MAWIHPAAEEYRRQRWTRLDAEHWQYPDTARWLPAEELRPLRSERPQESKDRSPLFDCRDWYLRHRGAAVMAANQRGRTVVGRSFDQPSARLLLAEIKLDLLRFCYWRKAYNPHQPRVPRGNSDGGEWTRIAAGGSFTPRGPGRGGPTFPGATPGQLLRLDQAIARTERALEGIRQYDPSWQPKTTSFQSTTTFEGAVRHAEARAVEAEARLEQLRSDVGGNLGPRLESGPPPFRTTVPSTRPLDAPIWINAYRAAYNMPDLLGDSTWPSDKGTVAVTEIDGSLYFGVNSTAPGYREDVDGDAAYRMRARLINRYPDVMETARIGEIPNDSVYHAESTVLIRAAQANGGTLAGRSIEVYTDRDMCATSCPKVLPKLGLELGNPNVTFVAPSGLRRTMRNGRWEP